MKPITLPEPKRSAKQFLLRMVPHLLAIVGVQATISFIGVKINIQQEANKRIYAMSEESAERILNDLKEMLQQW
jgi:hypothetical protein